MRTLIVYYSRTGTTRKLAEELAGHLNADTEELIDKKNREGAIAYLTGGRDALKGKETEIEEIKKDPSDYDLILLGSPVWAGKITPAVRTYMRCHKDKFGNVACFCTMGGTNPGKTFTEFEKVLERKPLSIMQARTIEVKKDLHKDKILDFVTELKDKTKFVPTKEIEVKPKSEEYIEIKMPEPVNSGEINLKNKKTTNKKTNKSAKKKKSVSKKSKKVKNSRKK